VFEETLRHESVHALLSPSWEPLANARMWIYQNSAVWRYSEEAIAESYATGSVAKGLAFPIGGYVTPARLAAEATGIAAAGYLTFHAWQGK